MNPRVLLSVRWLGIWFGCGRVPVAPGTFGTLGAVPLVWFFQTLGELPYMVAAFGFTVAAMVIGQVYEDFIATEHDSPEFVIDEVAGFLITMTWVPFTWPYVVLGFVIFRIIDALKPFPISWIDKNVPGGIGAVADDIAAGIAANILMQVMLQTKVLPL